MKSKALLRKRRKVQEVFLCSVVIVGNVMCELPGTN